MLSNVATYGHCTRRRKFDNKYPTAGKLRDAGRLTAVPNFIHLASKLGCKGIFKM